MIKIIFFFILYESYMIIKYIDSKKFLSQTKEFNLLFNTTHLSEIYILLRINVVKQYYFNNSLPIYDLNPRINNLSFINSFFNISTQFSKSILETSSTNNFLKNDYKRIFKQFIYEDFSNFIDITNDSHIELKSKYGFKPVIMETFEILRCLFIQYFLQNENNENQPNPLINDEKWYQIHLLLTNLIKRWDDNIIDEMNNSFYSMMSNLSIIYLSLFITIFVLITLAYCIVWRTYEENFHNLLKKSYDLINLIPKEIKSIIVSKLNE